MRSLSRVVYAEQIVVGETIYNGSSVLAAVWSSINLAEVMI